MRASWTEALAGRAAADRIRNNARTSRKKPPVDTYRHPCRRKWYLCRDALGTTNFPRFSMHQGGRQVDAGGVLNDFDGGGAVSGLLVADRGQGLGDRAVPAAFL